MKIRRVFLFFHTLCGVAVGLLLLVTGLTGGLLVFRDEVDATLNPSLMKVASQTEKVPLQTALDTVKSAHPGQPIRVMRLPASPDAAVLIQLRPPKAAPVQVFVDPYTGKELGTRNQDKALMAWVFDFHSRLMLGETGKVILGVFGTILIFLCVSGVVLWFPRGKSANVFRALSVAGGKRMFFDIHRVSGIVAVAALTLTATTGTLMALEHWTEKLFGEPNFPPPAAAKPATGAPLPIDELIRRAEAAIPGSRATLVNPPNKPADTVQVRVHGPGEWHPNGRSSVILDAFSGDVLAVRNAKDAPLGVRVYDSFYPLHTGKAGGIVGKLFQLLTALAPATLFVTGFAMWLRRVRR